MSNSPFDAKIASTKLNSWVSDSPVQERRIDCGYNHKQLSLNAPSGELADESFGVHQVSCIKAFGKPIVDWGEKFVRLMLLVLPLQ